MRFTEDPRIVFGTELGPDPERELMRGLWARAVGPFATDASPSQTIAPVFVTEQRVPRFRVRCYRASVGGHLWISPGVMTFSLLEYARLLLRAVLSRREPIPRAWVRGQGK